MRCPHLAAREPSRRARGPGLARCKAAGKLTLGQALQTGATRSPHGTLHRALPCTPPHKAAARRRSRGAQLVPARWPRPRSLGLDRAAGVSLGRPGLARGLAMHAQLRRLAERMSSRRRACRVLALENVGQLQPYQSLVPVVSCARSRRAAWRWAGRPRPSPPGRGGGPAPTCPGARTRRCRCWAARRTTAGVARSAAPRSASARRRRSRR